MKTKKVHRPFHKPGRGQKIKELGLLLAAGIVMSVISVTKADVPGYVFADSHYLALPNTISDWQETDTLEVCQRSRTVVDGGCWYDDLGNDSETCSYPAYGIADSQVGVYVPGIGCTDWKSTSYHWVSADNTYQGPLLQDQ